MCIRDRDKDLQTIVEREGAVLGRGAVVLLEAETGAIRAMASFPGYDVTDVAAALEAADSPFLNRATAAWNVGSIFKVCVAAAALENEVELPENYCCEGFYRLGDHSYFCHERAGHGTLDLQQAMQLSCNPYFVELGQMCIRDSDNTLPPVICQGGSVKIFLQVFCRHTSFYQMRIPSQWSISC